MRTVRLIPAHAGKTYRVKSENSAGGAHPRSRGENLVRCRPLISTAGSSPLTRGKHGQRWKGLPQGRLIPAHAGKTLRAHAWMGPRPAHPRSRGENRTPIYTGIITDGSSPLTRGKPGIHHGTPVKLRLIPAHAGKTRLAASCSSTERAHPRSRGENPAPSLGSAPRAGSSPLTRGKPHRFTISRKKMRLIPAHAGKTSSLSRGTVRPLAHPRSRGENVATTYTVGTRRGSSPLTRGKRRAHRPRSGNARLIPAHAGKTAPKYSRVMGSPAHPRSRGENERSEARRDRRNGSSPLTRGKPGGPRRVPARRRLIPAHAGKTGLRDRTRAGYRAHPRSRGENITSAVKPRPDDGSSPLTRGKRVPRGLGGWRSGLIPAHAGKTRTAWLRSWACPAHPRSRGENPAPSSPAVARRGSSPLTRGKPP